MNPNLQKRLEAEQQDEKLVDLKDKVRRLVKMSRGKMSESYKTWDRHQDTYRGIRTPDEEDLQARDLNEPEKMVVPMGFAQVQTFVAFAFLLYTQNRRFYEFVATGAEDHEINSDQEKLLERDLKRNYWNSKLYQSLLDIARFNLGVKKHGWVVDKQLAPTLIQPSETNAEGFGFQTPGGTSMQEFTAYEGNRIQNVSPYNFFPDTRFPLSDWRRGSFVADEKEWHINELKKRERKGLVFGVEHIKPMEKEGLKQRGGSTRLEAFTKFIDKSSKDEDEQIVCVTECQVDLIPKKYDLGDEESPIKYVVELANDDRVISAKPMSYLHGDWCYDVGQFSPDMHQQIGDSLSDTIGALQDVVSYLINSRLMSVRRSLDNNLVIDPSGVDMNSVESREPWILMKKGSPRLGVDKFVRQLNYVDTTAGHLADADMIMKIMQMVTGVNENAMGQFNGGRRSATEARAVNAGAASRMKMTATIIWNDCYAPMGRKMNINQRQGMSEEQFVKVLGESARGRYQQFHPQNPSDLVGVEDSFVFDSTLSSEKGFMAQSLQELVTAMFSNPAVMQVLPLDIGKMIEEIMTLRGVENIERFRQPQIPNGIPGPDLLNSNSAGDPRLAQGGAGVPPV